MTNDSAKSILDSLGMILGKKVGEISFFSMIIFLFVVTRTRKIVKKFHNKSLLFVCTESTELENFELKKMKISMWIRDISVWAGFNFRKLSLNLLVTFYWKFSTGNFLHEIFYLKFSWLRPFKNIEYHVEKLAKFFKMIICVDEFGLGKNIHCMAKLSSNSIGWDLFCAIYFMCYLLFICWLQ